MYSRDLAQHTLLTAPCKSLLYYVYVYDYIHKYIQLCKYIIYISYCKYFTYYLLIVLFPKQVYLCGSLLEKNRLDTLLGALGLVGRGFGPAGRAGLGWAWGLAVLGARCWACCGLGVGFGCAGRAGWVGRVWPCWARWLGWAWCWALGVVLGVGFGRAGRAGWVGRGVGRGVWAR